MTERLVKTIDFADPYIRSKLTFSDSAKIRLNPTTNQLELKSQGYNRVTGAVLYPTDTDLTVTVEAINPTALRQWLSFGATPTQILQPDGATVDYKLNDGTDDRYWGGASWDVAGASDFSSEEDVAGNIDSFPATSQTISLVIRLMTTDEEVTPTLQAIDFLMLCAIDYFDSLVHDALIPSIRTALRTETVIAKYGDGGDQVTLSSLQLEYNIVSVEGVYDHDNDPKHLTNLYASYDAAGQAIRLTQNVDSTIALWIEITIEPEVYVSYSSQDYVEVEKIPAVVLETIAMGGHEIYGQQAVKNPATLKASIRRDPFRLNLTFAVRLLADSTMTLTRMKSKALKHVQDSPMLPWDQIAAEVPMRLADLGLFAGPPDLRDKHEDSYGLELYDLHLFMRDEEEKNIIQRIVFTLTSTGLQGGPRWTDTK